MAGRRRLPQAIQDAVRQRANYLCEYCHTSELWQYVQFTIDHLVPLSQGGDDSLQNLALACFHCNRYKSYHDTAVDPQSGDVVAIFQPRLDQWSEHFIWSNDKLILVGLTPVGRSTIALLKINRPRVLSIRAADAIVGRHPPFGDAVVQRAG